MSNFINNLDCTIIRHWISNSLYCKIIINSNGNIIWSNRAFSNWIGYTPSEITSKNFSDFIIDNDNFSDNVKDSNIGNDDFITNYIVHKRFLRRNGSPEWGVFHIMKCPEINGERNDYYLCSWEPMNNTEEILTRKILQKIEKMTEEISEMTRTIVKLTESVAKSCEPDEESKWFSYTIKMIQKYPKASMLIIILILGSYGASNIINILSKLGFLTVAQ
jgi:PAS domain S-box-containing protein